MPTPKRLIALLALLLCAPPALAVPMSEHRPAVDAYNETIRACVARNKDGDPTYLSLVTINLKRLQWSYDSWMDKVWGKPKSDGFFVDMKSSAAAEAYRHLQACAANGDPTANILNNYNIAKIRAAAETVQQYAVAATRKLARQVAAVNPRNPTCKQATDQHAAYLNDFAQRYEQGTRQLVQQCTARIAAQAGAN